MKLSDKPLTPGKIAVLVLVLLAGAAIILCGLGFLFFGTVAGKVVGVFIIAAGAALNIYIALNLGNIAHDQ